MVRNFNCLAVIIVTLLAMSCSGKGGPQANDILNPNEGGALAQFSEDSLSGTGHSLLGFWWVTGDLDTGRADVVADRRITTHMNVLTFLEKAPCTDCMSIASMKPQGDGLVKIDIKLKHPYTNLNLSAFDVRGIIMFKGGYQFPASKLSMSDSVTGDGELINPDGYTSLYNSGTANHGMEGYSKGKWATSQLPNAKLNGYKRFVSALTGNTRNVFIAGDQITVKYLTKMPSPFVFGYAVDANWAPPTTKPVTNPQTDFGPEANCPEPWKLEVTETGPGINIEGGQTTLRIDVFDHQGAQTHHDPVVECPVLFSGTVPAVLKGTFSDFSRYEAVIQNPNGAGPGGYNCLVSVEANENNPSGKPWLDLKAYQVIHVFVGQMPLSPTPVSVPWLVNGAAGVCVQGNYLYAGTGNGLQVFNLTDPTAPYGVGMVGDVGAAKIVVSGNYAIAYDGASTLFLLRMDTPDKPYVIGKVKGGDNYSSIAIWGHYGYLTVSGGYLKIFDLSSSTPEHMINSVKIYQANDIKVSNGYAYIVHTTQKSTSHLDVFDVDPPESITKVGEVAVAEASYIQLAGHYAYIDGYGRFIIVDISNPLKPTVVKDIPSLGIDNALAVSGGYAFLVGQDTDLKVFDVDPPEDTKLVTYWDSENVYPDTIAIGNGYAYLTGPYDSPIYIVDIDPAEGTWINSIMHPLGVPYAMTVSGDRLYALTDSGFKVVSLDPFEHARIISPSIEFIASYQGLIVVDGGYAYVYDGGLKIYIIDVEPPEDIHIDKIFTASSNMISLAVEGGHVYFPTGTSLNIMQADPPESASVIKTIELTDLQNGIRGIGVKNGYAYVTGSQFDVVDVDPPDSASVIHSVDLTGYGITLSGKYAYVQSIGSLHIIDISSPESAFLINNFGSQAGSYSSPMCVSGGYLFVNHYTQANQVQDVRIFDVDPPETASQVAVFDFGAGSMSAYGNYFFLNNSAQLAYKLW
jgi:hypothetical protein